MNPRNKFLWDDLLDGYKPHNCSSIWRYPKFNVGDKVRVTKQGCKFSNLVVQIVGIRRFTDDGEVTFEVSTLDGLDRSTYKESSLERYIEPNEYKSLESGDRVELNHITKGLMRGTVKGKTGQDFEVLFDDGTVDRCPQSRLTLIVGEEREENKMEKLTGFKKIAVINFGGYKDYDYALYDDTVEAGDMVIVSGNAENQLVEVKDVVDVTATTNTDHITAEVIAKVDMTDYNKRIADRQRKVELMRLMDKKIAEAKEVDKYAEYAKFLGDDFAKMFEEFKSL